MKRLPIFSPIPLGCFLVLALLTLGLTSVYGQSEGDCARGKADSCGSGTDAPASSPNENDSDASRFYLRNRCNHPIRIALRYKTPNGEWKTGGWWRFDGKESARLRSKNKWIRSNNRIFYYYAQITRRGINYTWRGNHSKPFGNLTLPMKRVELSRDEDDDYVLSLYCRGVD